MKLHRRYLQENGGTLGTRTLSDFDRFFFCDHTDFTVARYSETNSGLPVYLPAYLSIYLSFYLSIYLSIYIRIYGSAALCWALAAFSVS
jgi:hypothetical protein